MLWMCYSICQQIWETPQWPQDWKRSVFISISKKGNAKECSNYCTTALISHDSKVMLKILQARLQQYVNRECPDVQAEFRKGRGTKDQIANICWIVGKSNRIPEKHLLLLHWLWSNNVGNLISGFSAFSKTSLNIWKFSVCILLKPSLENFEHYFASV